MRDIPKTTTVGAKLVVRELERRFLNVERIVEEAGLDLQTINGEDTWIPFINHAALLEIAARETRDENFGLHIAQQVDPRDFGNLAYIGLSSRTLGDALLNLERYLSMITEAFQIKTSVEGDLFKVKFIAADSFILASRQANEFVAGLFVNGYMFFTLEKISPAAVHFVHQFDGNSQEICGVLGCEVIYGENQFQICLNQKDLSAPIATADNKLLHVLTDHCDKLLKQRAHEKPEQVVQVERQIADLLPKGLAKAKIVATDLGMSERTLVRKLSECGTSFTEILDQLRHQLALVYLNQSELNLTQVSFLLGYSNQSAFSTAFKRSTGISPKEMRDNG